MRNWLAKFMPVRFGGTPPDPDAELGEIPRSPPFAKGIPAASVERLLLDQTDVVREFRYDLKFDDETYQHVIEPVIRNYAAYVHLLPASEYHHHRDAGGLLRHGLEVAHFAARGSKSTTWDHGEYPERRQARAVAWVVVSGIAGLLHDVGKIVSDVSVCNDTGEVVWYPMDCTLLEWAKSNDIKRYFLRWRHDRHGKHKQIWNGVVEKIIAGNFSHWLSRQPTDVVSCFYQTLGGSEKGGNVFKVVIEADRLSTSNELARTGKLSDPGVGVPVQSFIISAVRALIADRTINWNTRGQSLWHLRVDGQTAVYFVWPSMARTILEKLRMDSIPAIPRDPHTILEILAENDIAVPDESGWLTTKLLIEGIQKPLDCVRLKSPDVLNSIPPSITDAVKIPVDVGDDKPARDSVENVVPFTVPPSNSQASTPLSERTQPTPPTPSLASPTPTVAPKVPPKTKMKETLEALKAAKPNSVPHLVPPPPLSQVATKALQPITAQNHQSAAKLESEKIYNCLGCGHPLQDVMAGVCRDCGRPFDPKLVMADDDADEVPPTENLVAPDLVLKKKLFELLESNSAQVGKYFLVEDRHCFLHLRNAATSVWRTENSNDELHQELIAGGIIREAPLFKQVWAPLAPALCPLIIPFVKNAMTAGPIVLERQAAVEAMRAHMQKKGEQLVEMPKTEFFKLGQPIKLASGTFLGHLRDSGAFSIQILATTVKIQVR